MFKQSEQKSSSMVTWDQEERMEIEWDGWEKAHKNTQSVQNDSDCGGGYMGTHSGKLPLNGYI